MTDNYTAEITDLPDPDPEDALSFDEVEAAGLDGTNRFGPQV